MRRFIASVLIALSSFPLATAVHSETIEYYIVDNSAQNLTDLPRRSYGDDLFVSVGGMGFIITNEHLRDYPHKSIFAHGDFDDDGRKEIILEMHNGGNCCGYEYAIISHRGGKFFSTVQHQVFDGAGFPTLELIEADGETLLQVVHRSEGADNTSQSLTNSLLKFEHGEIKLLSQNENDAWLPAVLEVNSHEFDQENPVNIVKLIDMDGDAELDRLICSYWARWGDVVCDVDSSLLGYQDLSLGCDRFGVLNSSTNGLRDLVCNRSTMLIFNQSNYQNKQ